MLACPSVFLALESPEKLNMQFILESTGMYTLKGL